MSDALRPCPFCGSVGIAVISGKYTDYVSCESCGTQSAFVVKTPLLSAGELQDALSKNSAITAWNTRPVEDALRSENDALLAQWASVPVDAIADMFADRWGEEDADDVPQFVTVVDKWFDSLHAPKEAAE